MVSHNQISLLKPEYSLSEAIIIPDYPVRLYFQYAPESCLSLLVEKKTPKPTRLSRHINNRHT